ncbi:hypothetical protein QFC21_006562 [Naganishia friedmannii]|uniref:Uncharacterized protein n=1 Tax=Naganishia friedmannii TaxID=89922 RepID=A0ACC2V165_9TREE|nr:hypothetical protein QFC21_006562 [Naganishia friedmannii]
MLGLEAINQGSWDSMQTFLGLDKKPNTSATEFTREQLNVFRHLSVKYEASLPGWKASRDLASSLGDPDAAQLTAMIEQIEIKIAQMKEILDQQRSVIAGASGNGNVSSQGSVSKENELPNSAMSAKSITPTNIPQSSNTTVEDAPEEEIQRGRIVTEQSSYQSDGGGTSDMTGDPSSLPASAAQTIASMATSAPDAEPGQERKKNVWANLYPQGNLRSKREDGEESNR